jgi:hypothetical protein
MKGCTDFRPQSPMGRAPESRCAGPAPLRAGIQNLLCGCDAKQAFSIAHKQDQQRSDGIPLSGSKTTG